MRGVWVSNESNIDTDLDNNHICKIHINARFTYAWFTCAWFTYAWFTFRCDHVHVTYIINNKACFEIVSQTQIKKVPPSSIEIFRIVLHCSIWYEFFAYFYAHIHTYVVPKNFAPAVLNIKIHPSFWRAHFRIGNLTMIFLTGWMDGVKERIKS